MTDNEDEEQKPPRAQLEVAYPRWTFMDGGVSDDQLAAAYPRRQTVMETASRFRKMN